MILTIRDIMTKSETSYPLRKVEDFKVLFDRYPSAENIALRSNSVEDAIHKIAEYINHSSRLSVRLHDDVSKSEPEMEETKPKDVKLKVSSVESFAMSLKLWGEERKEEDRGIHRDSTYSPDPGYQKDPDPEVPVTPMERIKRRIEDEKQ